ncbi:hypothetical protein BDP27DRAFT_1315978 [Rhodocollybia butyracea]|uniref:Uncharacterized protein n=1 Tax=Rhodocollybia butyracea TaxID=206335 RepID=A0A9P5UD43_9AGAR|nr:hypothetical protein BDP27DRAFT_1315978 [Rhodocollybia butyracea]
MGKAQAQNYLDQVKSMAESAFATAQSYLPSTSSNSNSNSNSNSTSTSRNANGTLNDSANDALAQIHAGATTALQTGKEYIASAQTAAQPHIDRGLYMGNISGQTDPESMVPKKIPSTSAPLESGPHTVGTPYPSTTTKVGE